MATSLLLEPFDFCDLVEGALKEIAKGNMENTEEGEKLSISKKHEIAFEAVSALFKSKDVVIDINSEYSFVEVMKFIAVAKIPWQHVHQFFNKLFASQLLKFFEEEKWTKFRVFIA